MGMLRDGEAEMEEGGMQWHWGRKGGSEGGRRIVRAEGDLFW